jgi:transcriptional regulator with XRE-family HTH domain
VLDVSSSRIGACLKVARERLGWSREALAYHSGVSWSAIAQIESGRRKDVRLSSLSALAEALGVSVDYLIGRSVTGPQLLEHRVLTYGSDAEFLAAVVPYLSDGAERSDGVLAVTTRKRIELLRDSLGDRSDQVEFADSVDWYSSPSTALNRYRAFVRQKFDAGAAWIRIVGEPVWAGRSDAEVDAWTRYESMINLAFASSPTTIVCPYDTRSVPTQVLTDARRTHPEVSHGTNATPSRTYQEPADFLL